MTDAEAMRVIAELRAEVGELKSENKRLRKALREARHDAKVLFI